MFFMNKFPKTAFTCVCAVLLLGLAIFSENPVVSAAEKEQNVQKAQKAQKIFAASYFTMNNPHFIAWSEGLRSVIEAKGDKLIDLDPQLDINKQLAGIEDVLQQELAAIFIAPVDSEGIKSAYLACRKAQVPIINIDIPIPDDLAELCAFQVTTDNVMAGRVLGEAMIKHTGGAAKVALIDWSVNKAVTDRTEGFEQAIANTPGITIATRLDAAASVESALPVMETMLQSNPEITAVFGINDPTCMGALSAIQAAKREGQIGIYSIDGSREGIELVKEGKFVGTSAQFPYDMGVTAAEAAYKMLGNQPIEKIIRVKSVFIDADNVDEFLK
jgi:ribose transport system substrate-binding protein